MENQYEAPEEIEIDPAVEPQEIISVTKFIILCFFTFGVYCLWWMYKAWRFFQQKQRLNILPAARALFCIIFLNSLFKNILLFARKKDYSGSYVSEVLVAGYFILQIVGRLGGAYWLVPVLGFIFLVKPFQALNYAKMNSPELVVIERSSFSGKQITLIIVGSILWFFGLIGLFGEIQGTP